jgi:predicted homoserine dehydrogenase-like protein
MNLHAKLQQRAADRRPVRVGLIGAGKFGSMYLAQVPRTPGVHLVGIADLSAGRPSAPLPPRSTRRCATAARTSATTGTRWCAIRPST